MIQKQMMMIVSLLMAAIAIVLATDEEQLAQVRLPYHTSALTGEGWVMDYFLSIHGASIQRTGSQS